jgi:signal transduction histidine kinase
MKWFTQGKWLLVGFGTAATLMAVVNGMSYQNATQLIGSTNRSRETYEVIKNLVDVYADMSVAESGRRGYIFLDDEYELERHQAAIAALKLEMQTLKRQLLNAPAQFTRFQRLTVLMNQRLRLFEESIQAYQRDRSALVVQRSITNESVGLREQIQATIADLQREEEKALHQWLTETNANVQLRMLLELLITCLSFAVLAIGSWLLYRQLLKRQAAEAMGKALEQEKELVDLKLRFFSMVSHEFRTPLSIILGSAQMLAENNPSMSSDRRQKNIHRIQTSAELMTRHLTDMLTLTRAEAGNLEYNPQPLDVEAFCLNLLEDLQLSAPTESRLKFSSQGRCGLVSLDEKLLFSILSNLLLNAMKYSTSGSPIELQLGVERGGILFRITDTGIGITPTDQPNLYEPFFRGENAADIQGTGLGLVVVKRCVELHGGEIRVHSQVGVGTTFRVWLPDAAAQTVHPTGT